MAWVSCIYLPTVIHYHSHFLLTTITHVGGSNRINYISPSQCWNSRPSQATQFTPILSPFHPWHFMGVSSSPPSHPRLGSRGSAIHVFPVNLDVWINRVRSTFISFNWMIFSYTLTILVYSIHTCKSKPPKLDAYWLESSVNISGKTNMFGNQLLS